MHATIGGQTEDTPIDMPELRDAFYELIEGNSIHIRMLADTWHSNALVKELEQGCEKIIEAANRAITEVSRCKMKKNSCKMKKLAVK